MATKGQFTILETAVLNFDKTHLLKRVNAQKKIEITQSMCNMLVAFNNYLRQHFLNGVPEGDPIFQKEETSWSGQGCQMAFFAAIFRHFGRI